MKEEQLEQQWPDELDALIAAPRHHKLLFENEFVRVLDTIILPGEMTNLHTHQHSAALYILEWSDFIRYDAHGKVLLDSRTLPDAPKQGSSLWSGLLHRILLRMLAKMSYMLLALK